MGGSVYFAMFLAVIFIVLAFVATPILLIPGVVVVLVALFAAPMLAAIGRSGPGGAETGTPTTQDASYEPVAEPTERGA
jgi:hypothetical protein